MRIRLLLAMLMCSAFSFQLSAFSLIFAQEEAQPAVVEAGARDKITLDIKGMDIIDALKMLSARSGMNIVVGKNVSGRVTLFLKDVDIQDAFKIMLSANELAFDKQGDIINVMTQKDYELKYGQTYEDKKQVEIVQLKYAKAADLSRALMQIKADFGKVIADDNSNTLALIDTPQKIKEMKDFISNADVPIKTQVFSLNYAQADKLQPKIQEILTKNIGYLKIDERTNKIAVTDYEQKLAEVEKLIGAFDEKPQQVLIDAQIIQLTPTDTFEMGVDWDYWIKKYFDIKASLPIGKANRLIFGTPNVDPKSPGKYKAVIDVLRTIGDTKVLASPRIIVLNNQEAKIHVGVRDAYITSTTSQSGSGTEVTAQAVNFVDTGTQLYVTPTINRDGFITMKLKPEVSESTRTKIISQGQETEVPIVTASEAETTVMVKDGVTIIIGGLKKDKKEKTVKKIPLLGDIPGLGALFRSTSESLTQSELVILLTPHLMSGEASYVTFDEIKPKDGAVVKMVDGKLVTEKISSPELSPDSQAQLNLRRQYYDLVTDRINLLTKARKSQDIKGRVEVFFTLNAKGQLTDIPRVISSTNYELNDTAIKCVEVASPFPAFPEGMGRTEEDFRIAFEYK